RGQRNWPGRMGRFKTALGSQQALDRPGIDRLGKALDLLAPEVAELEQIPQQAAGGRSNNNASRFRQGLEPGGRGRGVTATPCSCDAPSPMRSPTTTRPVAIPTNFLRIELARERRRADRVANMTVSWRRSLTRQWSHEKGRSRTWFGTLLCRGVGPNMAA